MAHQETKRQTIRLIAIALVVSFTAVAAPRFLPFVAAAEAWLSDAWVALLTPAPATQQTDIAVLTITEDTLARFPYRSPIDRGFLVELLGTLEEAGVRAVGFDILFDKETEEKKDTALAKAILDFPVPIVIAWADEAAGLTGAQRDYLKRFLAASGAEAGFVNLLIDGDGVVRRQVTALPNSDLLSFTAALAEAMGRETLQETFSIAWRPQPVDGTDRFQSLPAHSILELSEFDPALVSGLLEDRIVLIGNDLPQSDRHRTLLSVDSGEPDTMPGVFIHAHVLAQLLDGQRLSRIDLLTEIALVLILVAAGVGLAALHIPVPARLGIGSIMILGFWAGSFALYNRGGPIVPLALPSLGLMAAYGVSSATLGYDAIKAKRFVRKAFAHYVPPALVEQLTNQPERLVRGGERRVVTLIFTDVAGFTTLSERLGPEVLMPLLNEYFDGMSRVALEHDGTIDKFIGDALVAFFGAPSDQPDHAKRAVACAVALDAFAEHFRTSHSEHGFGITRIGVHTGPAIVGNVGGSTRFDYTAIGDTVNTAARLESVNKTLGTRICIGGATVAAAPDVAMRPMGELILKGKSVGITAFEPISLGQAGSIEAIQYQSAYEAMASGEPKAREAFARLADAYPDDPLIALHSRRLDGGATTARIIMEEK